MSRRITLLTPLALAAIVAAGVTIAQDRKPARPQAAGPAPRTADEEAIRKQAREFAQAFAKRDAKAIAASWTEQAEYYEDGVPMFRGRAAVEQAFAEFFQRHHQPQIDVQIESIRFPSRDTAIEEGVLTLTPGGSELPQSSRYSVLHVREDGQWKTAIAREWGAAEDRLQDLAWLIGDWVTDSKDGQVRLSFTWNTPKSCIEGRFAGKAEGGRPASAGHQWIMRDPQTGQLRSWMFDEAGGRGQAVWFRDGNRWVLDAAGVAADGTETAASNVLTRLNDDEFLWRSVNRSAGSDPVAHTDAVKLTRVKSSE
jgi:uncharacterized protein (TIGR02246 family)